ncbi:helix-turn-helix domain-containing protein [Leisingera sp. M523]|uniref:helix-turn-helix domain-containing protein n=1 Tax=Leisingera sp. M523 TaxID=2867013 RepID=UPI0021A41E6C|nr:helix-turn-helix transcriptional regulator [Leisingera sp. M523]UWQ30224.1 helix-turn-helix domain-containing protein [Leisingera sp. M523]
MQLTLRIRELRKTNGLTLAELAGKIGVSAPHLSEVERGKKNLNNHLIERIADALGVSPTELLGAPPRNKIIGDLEKYLSGKSEKEQQGLLEAMKALEASLAGGGTTQD